MTCSGFRCNFIYVALPGFQKQGNIFNPMLDCSYEAKQKRKARGHCLEKQSSFCPICQSHCCQCWGKMPTTLIHVKRTEVPQNTADVFPIFRFWEMQANTAEAAMPDKHHWGEITSKHVAQKFKWIIKAQAEFQRAGWVFENKPPRSG